MNRKLTAILIKLGVRNIGTQTTRRNAERLRTTQENLCKGDNVTFNANEMLVYKDFISVREEEALLNEIEPYLKRLRYETSHWDDAIHGYRETEKAKWTDENMKVIKRMREVAFPSNALHLGHIHVLDISKEGYIKAHVDSIRFCGDTITGLSLLSSSVMRLVNEEDKSQVADILLERRSLYVMKGAARYKFTHEVLQDKCSYFRGIHVPRERRISVICRNEPVNPS